MLLPQTAKTNSTDRVDFSKSLDDDVLYVLQRLEKVIFREEAVTERNEVNVLFASKGYKPLTDLYEVVGMDLRIAFLRLQCTALENTSHIKMTGDLNNIADNVDVAVIDGICKSIGFDAQQIFDLDWVNKNKAALLGTKYETLVQNENNESGGEATKTNISADPYQ